MTSRKIIAVFDTRDAAENARDGLLELGLQREQISIADQSSSARSVQTPQVRGNFWTNLKEMFMPDEDRHTIEESLRRGGYVVVATVDDNLADAAISRLEGAGAVDLSAREGEWRAGGWQGKPTSTTGSGAAATSAYSTGVATDARPTAADSTAPRTPPPVAASADEARTADPTALANTPEGVTIPVIEERLLVGKREVNRGSVRVRSYIVEEPVHEEVRLREEHVDVQRRPVDTAARPVAKGAPEDLLQERTIEVSETAEQAVVGKEARVTEEVVVTKTANERVEQIDDTVRRTEVEVEDGRTPAGRTTLSRTATANTDPSSAPQPGRTP